MTPAELAGFLERRGLTAAAFGAEVEPPIPRQTVYRLRDGNRRIGAGMAARLREAMRRIEARGERERRG